MSKLSKIKMKTSAKIWNVDVGLNFTWFYWIQVGNIFTMWCRRNSWKLWPWRAESCQCRGSLKVGKHSGNVNRLCVFADRIKIRKLVRIVWWDLVWTCMHDGVQPALKTVAISTHHALYNHLVLFSFVGLLFEPLNWWDTDTVLYICTQSINNWSPHLFRESFRMTS